MASEHSKGSLGRRSSSDGALLDKLQHADGDGKDDSNKWNSRKLPPQLHPSFAKRNSVKSSGAKVREVLNDQVKAFLEEEEVDSGYEDDDYESGPEARELGALYDDEVRLIVTRRADADHLVDHIEETMHLAHDPNVVHTVASGLMDDESDQESVEEGGIVRSPRSRRAETLEEMGKAEMRMRARGQMESQSFPHSAFLDSPNYKRKPPMDWGGEGTFDFSETTIHQAKSSPASIELPQNSQLHEGETLVCQNSSQIVRLPPQRSNTEGSKTGAGTAHLQAGGVLFPKEDSNIDFLSNPIAKIDRDKGDDKNGSANYTIVEHPSISRQSSNQNRNEFKHFQKQIIDRFEEIAGGVLFPNNRFLFYWDIVILCLIMFIVFYVPFQVGVSNGVLAYSGGYYFLFGTFINLVFIVDIGLNFFRAYFDSKGRIVFNRKRIVRHYVKGWFILDLIGCFPVDSFYRFLPNSFQVGSTSINFISFLNLFRLFRLNRASRIVATNSTILIYRLRNFHYNMEMIKIVLFLTIFTHWIGCMFCLVALLEAGSFETDAIFAVPNWINGFQTTHSFLFGEDLQLTGNTIAAIWARYTVSLYWAVTTTTSIGYGDVTPVTVAEMWYCIIVELMAGLMWSYVIASIIGAVEEIGRMRTEFRDRMVQINRLAEKFQTEKSEADQISNDARLFLHRQFIMSTGRRDGTQLVKVLPVLDHLPPRLRNRVCLAMVEDDLRHVRYFANAFVDIHTLGGIASYCEIHQYDTGEIMYLERNSSSSKRGLFVLRSGVLAMNEISYNVLKGSGMRIYCKHGTLMHDFIVLPTSCKAIPEVVVVAFLTYTEVLFVPRKAIKALFRIHPEVWKETGRWCALRALMKRWAKEVLGRRYAPSEIRKHWSHEDEQIHNYDSSFGSMPRRVASSQL